MRTEYCYKIFYLINNWNIENIIPAENTVFSILEQILINLLGECFALKIAKSKPETEIIKDIKAYVDIIIDAPKKSPSVSILG